MGKFPKQHVNIPFEDEKLPDSGIKGTLGARRQQGGHVCKCSYSPMPCLGGSTCGAHSSQHMHLAAGGSGPGSDTQPFAHLVICLANTS